MKPISCHPSRLLTKYIMPFDEVLSLCTVRNFVYSSIKYSLRFSRVSIIRVHASQPSRDVSTLRKSPMESFQLGYMKHIMYLSNSMQYLQYFKCLLTISLIFIEQFTLHFPLQTDPIRDGLSKRLSMKLMSYSSKFSNFNSKIIRSQHFLQS